MAVTRLLALTAPALFAFTANATAAPIAYDFDKNHTEVRFCWNHFSISRQCAHFLSFDGEVVYDEVNPENSKVQVTFKTDSIETLIPVFNDHMRSDKLFDAKSFPEISFKSTKFERTGEKTGKVQGELTVKGVTKPVILDVTLNYMGPHPVSKHPTIGIGAITSVNR
ncbi:MAG TPA: YceI family protein, partial [Hyphomicrobiales bacterium]|nr:YceI family protein [Hyphomicrobiales bacterium]